MVPGAGRIRDQRRSRLAKAGGYHVDLLALTRRVGSRHISAVNFPNHRAVEFVVWSGVGEDSGLHLQYRDAVDRGAAAVHSDHDGSTAAGEFTGGLEVGALAELVVGDCLDRDQSPVHGNGKTSHAVGQAPKKFTGATTP